MSTASRIFETLTGLVKLAVGESLRRVHRANQTATVQRAQRVRTSAKARAVAKLMAPKPESKHRGGRDKPAPQAWPNRVRVQAAGGGEKAVYVYITDRPRGRVYPAVRETTQWVSCGKRGRAARHRERVRP